MNNYDLLNGNDFLANTNPTFSIITVCLNDKVGLNETLSSLEAQTSSAFESIIIDGGSVDGSIEICENFPTLIDHFCSESDKGIYDAMNKGVKIASGRWSIFMNAGDKFFDSTVLKKLEHSIEKNHDVIYGSHEVLYENGHNVIKKPKSIDNLWKGMIFSHQSVLVKTDLLKANPFELDLLTADFDFFSKVYRDDAKFLQIDEVISSVSPGGISDIQRGRVLKEWMKISTRYSLQENSKIYFQTRIFIELVEFLIKKILPTKLVAKITKLKNSLLLL